MVGDSIQEEFYFTLLSSFWKHREENCNPSLAKTVHCASNKTSGGPNFQVAFIRNDYLSLNAGEPATDGDRPWVAHINKFESLGKATILIINRGAHYVNDSTLVVELRTTMRYLKAAHPNLLIIYRSTSPGHMDYLKYFNSAPLSAYHIDLKNDLYHYADFARQNNLTRSLLCTEFPEVVYMDVYPSTALRADSHADPLHYCNPGPIDNWVRFLFNTIALLNATAVK